MTVFRTSMKCFCIADGYPPATKNEDTPTSSVWEALTMWKIVVGLVANDHWYKITDVHLDVPPLYYLQIFPFTFANLPIYSIDRLLALDSIDLYNTQAYHLQQLLLPLPYHHHSSLPLEHSECLLFCTKITIQSSADISRCTVIYIDPTWIGSSKLSRSKWHICYVPASSENTVLSKP